MIIKKGVDLNSILQFCNILFTVLTIITFNVQGENEYVNKGTVWLGIGLSSEIAIFLFFERRRRDPFVLLLSLQMVFYFIFRVLTLTYNPFSVVFLRYPFTVSDLNYALCFIIISNIAIYLGLSANRISHKFDEKEISNIKPRNPYLVIVVLVIGYFMAFSYMLGLGLSTLVGLLNSLFINLGIMLFMILVYLILFYRQVQGTIRYLLIAGVIIFVIFQTLSGSRSGILTLMNFMIFGTLAVFGYIKIKRSYILGISLLVPVMIALFLIATFIRPRLEERSHVGTETFEIIKEFDIGGALKDDAAFILGPVFDRIGFLDYCAEIMSNSDKYAGIFNAIYYAESIIDNVISPGFDVFNVPRTSNALKFIYNREETPKKSRVGQDGYQSDEFTLYGELYALSGKWFALIPIFFIGFFSKRFYVMVKDTNKYKFFLKRSFILATYYGLLNSFGLDWVLLDILGIVFTYYIFKRFFKFNISNIAE